VVPIRVGPSRVGPTYGQRSQTTDHDEFVEVPNEGTAATATTTDTNTLSLPPTSISQLIEAGRIDF